MAKKLKKMRIDAVGVVDAGANQDAMIVIAKRGTVTTGAGAQITELRMTEQEQAAAQKAAQDKQVALEKELADAKAARDAATKELAELKGTGVLTSDAETLRKEYEKTQGELEKARADLQKQLESANTEKQAALAEVEKIQKARRRERFIKRAADLTHLPGAHADDFGEFLDEVEKAVGEKRFTKFLNQLDSWNTLLEKNAVFTELGRSGMGEYALAGPEAQLDIMAKEIVARDPKISYPQAYDRVLQTPEGKAIYKRHVAQTRKEQ